MTGFFPETSKRDILKSILVIIFLIMIAFVPSFMGRQGLLLGTGAGIVFFVFFLMQGFFIYWKFPFQTKNSLSKSIKIPIIILCIFISGFVTSLSAIHFHIFNDMTAHILTGGFASILEIFCIYYVSMYITMLAVFIIRNYIITINQTHIRNNANQNEIDEG